MSELVKAPHPAKYSDQLLPVFARMLQDATAILDPMAGTGKIFALRNHGITAAIYANEIQPYWAAHHPETRVGDALDLPYRDNTFDAICVSPAFGNRMSDHHNAKDGSKRNTYRHYYGAELHPNNGGALPWGPKYRTLHVAAWAEAKRVLSEGGVFVLDIKDFYKTMAQSRVGDFEEVIEERGKGRALVRVRVTDWHCAALGALGFHIVEHAHVLCGGNRQGANGQRRIDYHSVIKFVLGGQP